MKTILPAFDILSYGLKPPSGFTPSSGHIVFDVKMDFTRTSCWVKDGHLTQDPMESNYAGVVYSQKHGKHSHKKSRIDK